MAKEKEVTVPKGTLERVPRAAPFGDIDRMFDDFFGRRWLRPFTWERPSFFAEMPAMPSIDVIDRDDEVVVRAEVPGYKKEDIEVSVSNSSLTIKGETKTEEKEEKGDYYRCEISRGAFTRSFQARITQVAIVVTGQGVVRANDSEVQALIFLTQVVTRDGDGEGAGETGSGIGDSAGAGSLPLGLQAASIRATAAATARLPRKLWGSGSPNRHSEPPSSSPMCGARPASSVMRRAAHASFVTARSKVAATGSPPVARRRARRNSRATSSNATACRDARRR